MTRKVLGAILLALLGICHSATRRASYPTPPSSSARETKNAVGRPTSTMCQNAWMCSCSSG